MRYTEIVETQQRKGTLFVQRRLLNADEVFHWADAEGLKTIFGPELLHVTLATVRTPVMWPELQANELRVNGGGRSMARFGSANVLVFDCPEIAARHSELAALYPEMDHGGNSQPHVSLSRTGKPFSFEDIVPYSGQLIFGPEEAQRFIPLDLGFFKSHMRPPSFYLRNFS